MNISNGIENLSQILPSATLEPAGATAKPGISQTGISQTGASASSGPAAGQTDKAQLSAIGTQAAQAAASDNSDVRLDKVASIQAALAAGTYDVPASAVARKLVGALLAPEK